MLLRLSLDRGYPFLTMGTHGQGASKVTLSEKTITPRTAFWCVLLKGHRMFRWIAWLSSHGRDGPNLQQSFAWERPALTSNKG